MPTLVIFDCDGVLVDSEILANEIFCSHINQLGLDYSLEQTMHKFVGRSLASGFAILEAELGHPLPGDFKHRLDVATFAAFADRLQPVLGIVDALDQIQPLFQTCIASSGGFDKMAVTLKLTKLEERFLGRIFSATQVKQGKPAPDLFLFAAQSLGFSPKQCVVIEDSCAGVEAAVAAGMQVLGYAALTSAEQLRAAGATTFQSMEQLPTLLSKLRFESPFAE